MSTLTSQLVIELLDRVTGPARRAANALAGISNAIREANGQPITFGDRLDAAITRNNRALADARGGLVDAVGGYYLLREAIGAPIRTAMEFEEAMANVTKVVDFPTPEAFSAFEQQLFRLSRRIPLTVQELSDIAAAAGEAGFAADDLLSVTEDAARIAVAFGTSAREAGDMLAAMQQSYGMSREEALGLADAMNHLSDSMASRAPELMNFWTRVAADAGRAGFTQEQAVALGSAMIASGHEAEVAATSFRAMIRALTRGESATTRQVDAFERLGLSTTEVAARMQEDAVGTTREVLEAISRMPAEVQNALMSDIFGDEARALGSIATNLEFFDRAIGAVADSSEYAGSVQREFFRRANTLTMQLQLLMNRIYELSKAIGQALTPGIRTLNEMLGPLVTRLAELASAYPDVTAAVVAATAAVIGFRVAVAALRFAGLVGRGGILSMIAMGYNTIGRAAIGARAAASSMIGLQTALAAMSGQPLGTLGRLRAGLTGIALAVPGVGALSSGIAAIGAAVATISAPVWGTFAAIAAAVAAAGLLIYRYWDRITAVLTGVGQAIREALQPGLEWVGEKLAFLNPVVDAFGAAWGAVRDRLSGLGDLIGGLFEREVLSEDAAAGITERARQVTEGIIGWFTSIPTRLGEVAAQWFEAGRALIQSLWDGMIAVFSDLQAWIESRIDALLQPLRDARAALANLNPFGGGGGEVDGQRAKGGPISRGGTYLVGEEGPELITANRNGYVNPTGQGAMGGSLEVSINAPITVNGGVSDPQQLAAEISRQMRDEVREAFRGVFADTGMRFA